MLLQSFKHGRYIYRYVCIEGGRAVWLRCDGLWTKQRYLRILAKRREVIAAFEN